MMLADTLTLGSCREKRYGTETRERVGSGTHDTRCRDVKPNGRILLKVDDIELLDKESIRF